MHTNKELRKLPADFLTPVAEILEINDDWKRVMNLVPKNLESDEFEPKYNSEHIRKIETHARQTKTKCAKVLFEEWGTSGRVRPTVETLLNILIQAQIFRAADTLARQLGLEELERPDNGPAAPILEDVSALLNNESVEQKSNSSANFRKDSYGTNGRSDFDRFVPTKQMKSANLIEFSTTNVGELSIPQRDIKKENSNLIMFSENTDLVPDFEVLNPVTEPIEGESYSTMSVESTVNNSEMSLTVSDVLPGQSEISRYPSSFHIPSSSRLYSYGQIDMDILTNSSLIQFKYRELETITKNFNGTHIGSGGFGDVFVGTHQDYGELAVKRAHNSPTLDIVKIFNSEVKSLAILNHINIVPILGYAVDGPTPCIVCQYINGGSLQQNIADKLLNKKQRMNIMTGTAEGLKYIHTTVRPKPDGESNSSKNAYFLHGDVKSANILLTKDCVPKLCDFGLSKEFEQTLITKSIMGTSAYMAPEKFSGTVTQKGDIFSFGIVLLELLTGLPAVVTANNETNNIKTYVEENCPDDDISSLLDPIVQPWTEAQDVYNLATLCLSMEKRYRPTMVEICDTLDKIFSEK